VALGDIHLRFTWQAWHHLTLTLVLRGRRGTHDTPRPPLPPAARLSHTTQLCHTASFTYNFHTQLCQPPSFTYLFAHTTFTRNFVTHHLSHTLFHTPFCHTPSFNFVRHSSSSSSSSSSRRPPVTHNTTLSHTIFHTQLSHTTLSTTRSTEDHGTPHSAHSRSAMMPHAGQMTLQCWRKKICLHCRALTSLSHTPSFTHNFVTHTHIHAYIHTYTRTYVRTYIRTYVHTYIRTYVHTYTHTIFSHTFLLCHTLSFTCHFVTHNCFNFSILHHLLCLSFLPRPRYNL